jgi:RNA polymerase sigma-70 factor, ECF subfamily
MSQIRPPATSRLLEVMSPDVVLLTDGGGKMQAALRPIRGSDKVARWFGGVWPRAGSFTFDWTTANGRPAVLFYVDGAVDTFATLTVRDGKVDAIYVVRNPDKLGHLAEARGLTRA